MGNWLINVLVMFDEFVNAVLGAPQNETISARAAMARAAGKPWGCILCGILDRLQANHCANALRDYQDL